jgi:omega-amidase
MTIMNELTVGCFQMEVLPGDVEGNLNKVERILPQLRDAGCQLAVFPEMWTGGFGYPVLQEMADRTPKVLLKLREWAAKYRMVLVGSLPEAEGGKIFNTSFVLDASGEVAGTYRKIHLFSLTGEPDHFGRGQVPLVCDTRAGRLGVVICYDLRFPELARRLALDGAEIICFSALWPVSRVAHWSLLLRSRAVENQLFVIGCNGCGIEGITQYGGASAIISPTGRVIAEAGEREEVILGELNFAEMADFRRHLPCFSDRLPGSYGIL